MTKLLLIHGRGQGGKDPEALKRKWHGGLNAGLTLAGHPTVVDPGQLVFPFYGDVLETEKLRARASGTDLDLESASSARRQHIDPMMPDEVAELESDLLKSMANEVARETGVELVEEEGFRERILRIPGARALAEFLARQTGADQELIENFLPDVAVYLRLARKAVLDVIHQFLQPTGDERLIIIAHSLGGAVARDLLDDAAVRARTDLFVTLGAPLGLEAVYRNLQTRGPSHPKVQWVTAFDPDDFVALGHPLRRLYKDPLVDLRVDNPNSNPHGIEHYLGQRTVANRIATALAG
jgi:hypothetical protein